MTDLVHLLEGYRYDASSEDAVQRGIGQVLSGAGIDHEREVKVECGRLDFLVGATAIEVKLDGGTNALIRQLLRYAQLGNVAEIIVATTRNRLAQVPRELNGTPVRVALLTGGSL